jgi:hypothetical protein
MDRSHRIALACRLAVAALVATPLGARAQEACPTPATAGALRLTAGAPVTVPADVRDVRVLNPGGNPVDISLAAPVDGTWAPTAEELQALAAQLQTGERRLSFRTGDGTERCRRAFAVDQGPTSTLTPTPIPTSIPTSIPTPTSTPPLGPTPTPSRAQPQPLTERTWEGPQDCRAAGAEWERELARRPGHRGGRFTVLVFLEGTGAGQGDVCYYNREYGVVGDPIYVAVFSSGAVVWRTARYEPCALQAAAPNVLQTGERFPAALQSGTWKLRVFLERRCYNTAVDVTIVGARPAAGGGEEAVTQRYPLQQYDRYRATLQLGVLFTPQHDRGFGLRPAQADAAQQFVYDKGPSDTGPEYVASLVVYSVFKYLPSLLGRRLAGDVGGAYAGRDVIHDQDFFDRLGAVLGVGLRDPGKRFVAGGSFEVIYGVNVTGTWEFARVNELSGVSTTEPFKGTVEQIPTREVWNRRFSAGLSIDMRYATALFTGGR